MQSNDLSSLIRADISLSSDCLASLIAFDSIESPDLDLLSDLGLIGLRAHFVIDLQKERAMN